LKLLLDENLSPKLVRDIAQMFPGSQHVHLIGLASASDQEVWQYATRGGYAIVSKTLTSISAVCSAASRQKLSSSAEKLLDRRHPLNLPSPSRQHHTISQ
jgi:predicted nuclease of predicted toxin-antitoxin system